MIKLNIQFRNIDKILKEKEKKTLTQLEKGMAYILKLIIDTAKVKYLMGPYPQLLRQQQGSIRRNLLVKVEKAFNEIVGNISIGQLAYYAAVWEPSEEYKHRIGRVFPKAKTPMTRPFIKPAYESLREKIKQTLKEQASK